MLDRIVYIGLDSQMGVEMTDKYCRDCRHLKLRNGSGITRYPDCYRDYAVDLVMGEVSGRILDAGAERLNKYGCGMEAKYFSPKIPKAPETEEARISRELANPPAFKNYAIRGKISNDWIQGPTRFVRVEVDQLELVLLKERDIEFEKSRTEDAQKESRALKATVFTLQSKLGEARKLIDTQNAQMVEAMDERDRWKAVAKKADETENRCRDLKEQIGMWKETVFRARMDERQKLEPEVRQDERRQCWEIAKSFLPAPGSVTLLVDFEKVHERISAIRAIANAIRPDGEKMI